jgi:hypothetical protein
MDSAELSLREWESEANWHCFHLFYASSRDSRQFVPSHPQPWPRTDPPTSNMTPNFANRSVYLPLVLIAIPVVLLCVAAFIARRVR